MLFLILVFCLEELFFQYNWPQAKIFKKKAKKPAKQRLVYFHPDPKIYVYDATNVSDKQTFPSFILVKEAENIEKCYLTLVMIGAGHWKRTDCAGAFSQLFETFRS